MSIAAAINHVPACYRPRSSILNTLREELRMADRALDAVLDQLDAAQQAGAIDGANALAFLQAIYRDRGVSLFVRMRAAIEALPFERPKLSATAVFAAGDDFATRLERAIARSGVKMPRIIEAVPTDYS
jgi:hypothetical protein